VKFHPVSGGGSRATRPLRFAEAVRAEIAKERFDCVFSLERTLQQDVYRAGDGVHRVWLQRRKQFAPWWKKPLVGGGAFHRNMLALEAQTFDPANTRHIIVNSEMVRREILEHFPFPAERIHLVRNGVDLARFQSGARAATRARLGVKDDESLLLFVGSGWERKGLAFLLRLMADLRSNRGKKPARLLVAGKGKPPTATTDVIFAGPVADVENLYAAADAFVFLPIYEPSANVVAEALAAGLPVVTSAQNGAAEFIRDGVNGSVVANPADRAEVFSAVRFWLDCAVPRPVKTGADLSLERNMAETLAVLELAAREQRV
jgi:UDP-glucose:(heptosyl)LPS alpha-1,3-glucosyltransferase